LSSVSENNDKDFPKHNLENTSSMGIKDGNWHVIIIGASEYGLGI
jgi:hypothetical protein